MNPKEAYEYLLSLSYTPELIDAINNTTESVPSRDRALAAYLLNAHLNRQDPILSRTVALAIEHAYKLRYERNQS